MKKKAYLTPNEVAQLFMVSPITVRQWAQKGILRAMTTAGGHRRFTMREVERFAKERNLALQLPHRERLSVLIVDDDEQVLDVLKEMLNTLDEDLEVSTARDGFEAGRQVQIMQPDVMLLDLMMPGMNGLEVCRRLNDDPSTKAIRVVAMTGFYDDENVRNILEAGADVCLRKPISRDELIDALGI